jgi:FAD linked oxidases, C-terminal domain
MAGSWKRAGLYRKGWARPPHPCPHFDLLITSRTFTWHDFSARFWSPSDPRRHPPEVIAAMRAVKEIFDPDGILNPGKIFAS